MHRPAFVFGPKSNVSREKNVNRLQRKPRYVRGSDFRGRLIVDGRLVDLRYDAIEIELADGSLRSNLFTRPQRRRSCLCRGSLVVTIDMRCLE